MPETKPALRNPASGAVIMLAVLAVLFAMREAKTIVVPMLLAFFLAAVADSPISWLERKGLSRVLAVILVVSCMILLTTILGVLVGSSVQELTEQAPQFQQAIRKQLDMFLADLGGPQVSSETAGLLDYISPGAALGLAAGVLTSVRDLLGSAFLIIILMMFMLFEVPSLRKKLESLGAWNSGPSIPEIMSGYLVIKTLTSLATGILIGLFLTLLKVDFAVLWGLLAFLLNYIPSIGSFVASVPTVLVTYLQSGPALAILVATGYLVINLAIGNGVEPRIMGQGLGLSTLVVFLSLILWGWLLGPVGMLLSTPLTTMVRIALSGYESTQPIALLLGRHPTLVVGPVATEGNGAGEGTRTPKPEGGGF